MLNKIFKIMFDLKNNYDSDVINNVNKKSVIIVLIIGLINIFW